MEAVVVAEKALGLAAELVAELVEPVAEEC